MNLKRTKIAAVVGAALASFGIASTAHAVASGEVQAVRQIIEFGLYNDATSAILNAAPGGDFAAFLALDDASVNATLNGTNAPQNTSLLAQPPSPPMDLKQAQIGSPYGQNDFGQHTAPAGVPPGTGYFARSDQQLLGVLVAGIPAVPGPGNESTPASSKLVAEVGLTGPGQGTANTTSGTSGTAIFTLANNGIKVKITFKADPYLYAQLSPALIGRASQSLSFTLLNADTGAQVFQWSPNGKIDTITGGTEFLDPLSLNNGVGADAISNGPNCFPVSCADPGFVTYSFVTDPLSAGVRYQLTFNETVTANLTTVPEPGSLALLGVALLGLGFGKYRKSRWV